MPVFWPALYLNTCSATLRFNRVTSFALTGRPGTHALFTKDDSVGLLLLQGLQAEVLAEKAKNNNLVQQQGALLQELQTKVSPPHLARLQL